MHRLIIKLSVLSLLCVFLVAVRCFEAPLDQKQVVRFASDCDEGAVSVPEANMTQPYPEETWFQPEWTKTLEPPIGAGDCVAIEQGAVFSVRQCCIVSDEKLCSGAMQIGSFGGPCDRMFSSTGDAYSQEAVEEWNQAHGL